MTIKAKFQSTCPNCQRTINVGDVIEWEPGVKARHAVCIDAATATRARQTGVNPYVLMREQRAAEESVAFNADWARMKDEFAQREREEEARAFMSDYREEDWDHESNTPWGSPPVQPGEERFGASYWDAEEAHRDLTTPSNAEIDDPTTQPQTIPHGTYTVEREDGSGYVTIRIATKGPGSNYAGQTWLFFLAGPDNETEYQPFARIFPDGNVRVWKRFQEGGNVQKYVDAFRVVMGDDEARKAAGYRWALESSRCYNCGRKLTVPASIHRGLGPDCAARAGL